MSYPPRASMYGRPEGEQYTQQQIQQQQARNVEQKLPEKKPTPKASTRFLHMGQYSREETASSEHFYRAIGYSKYAGKYQPFEIPDVYSDRSRWYPVLSETPEGLQVSFRPTMRTIGEYAKLGLPVKYAMLGYPVPKIPEGYKIGATKETSEGIQYTFTPISQPQPSVAQQLAGIEAPTLRSLIGVKAPYYAQGPFMTPETFHPLAGISGFVVAPVESAVYGGMDIYSFATGQQLTHPEYPPWTIKGAPEYTFFRVAGEVTLSYLSTKAVQSIGSYVYEASGLKYSHFAYEVGKAKLALQTGVAKVGLKTPEWVYHAGYTLRNWAEETPVFAYGKRLMRYVRVNWLGETEDLARGVVSYPSTGKWVQTAMGETLERSDVMAPAVFSGMPSRLRSIVPDWAFEMSVAPRMSLYDVVEPAVRVSARSAPSMATLMYSLSSPGHPFNARLGMGGLPAKLVPIEKTEIETQLPYIPRGASQARTTLPKLASLGALLGISKLAIPTVASLTRSSVSARPFVGVSPIAEAMQIPKVAAVQMVGVRSVQLQKLLQLPSGMGDLTFQMPRFDFPEDLAPTRRRKGKRRVKRRYGMGEFWYPQPPSDLFGKSLKGVKRILG